LLESGDELRVSYKKTDEGEGKANISQHFLFEDPFLLDTTPFNWLSLLCSEWMQFSSETEHTSEIKFRKPLPFYV
jgi:hypothetical protein